MKFNTIIIGGGLSALLSGIALQKKGNKCLIISAGQGMMHSFSGSFDLAGYKADGSVATSPAEAIATYGTSHPYNVIGTEKVLAIADEAQQLLTECGVKATGSAAANHQRVTPVGALRPTWLTLNEYVSATAKGLAFSKATIASIKGFMDLPVDFLAEGLSANGVEVKVAEINTPELAAIRKSPSEMRATNVARTLAHTDAIKNFAAELNKITDTDVILIPAALGFKTTEDIAVLQQLVSKPVKMVATLPPSVSGVRTLAALRRKFEQLGGTYLLGDTVKGGEFKAGRLCSVATANHPNTKWEADNFVLATGNFVSCGLVATPNEVLEPALGLDVVAAENRADWYTIDMFKPQAYMAFGVKTDADFHPSIKGETIANLYAVGSVLSGANQIKEASVGGLSIISALHVAKKIA